MNLGIGVVKGNIHNEEINTDSHFALHFNVGYFIFKSVQAGITLNGWLFEPFGEIPFASKGEGISNGMVHIQYYPIRNKRFYFKSAYGLSEYTNLRPEENFSFYHQLVWQSYFYSKLQILPMDLVADVRI